MQDQELNIVIKQKWDEERNQRIIIIYGDTLNDGINRNGQMDIISNAKEFSYYHSVYFCVHAQNNYTQDGQYQQAIENASSLLSPVVPLYLQNVRYNNIIFTETTKDNSEDRYGIFYFPAENPSEEQYSTLNDIIGKLKGFKEILFYGKPYIDKENNTLNNEIIFSLKGSELDDLEEIIRKSYQKEKIR